MTDNSLTVRASVLERDAQYHPAAFQHHRPEPQRPSYSM